MRKLSQSHGHSMCGVESDNTWLIVESLRRVFQKKFALEKLYFGELMPEFDFLELLFLRGSLRSPALSGSSSVLHAGLLSSVNFCIAIRRAVDIECDIVVERVSVASTTPPSPSVVCVVFLSVKGKFSGDFGLWGTV